MKCYILHEYLSGCDAVMSLSTPKDLGILKASNISMVCPLRWVANEGYSRI